LSWIQKLQETYDRCAELEQFENYPLMPVGHTEQQTHLEITLRGDGTFRRATVVAKETIFIPATEASAGRTSGPIAHPLVDKLQYIAADYKVFGGSKDSQHDLYLSELKAWAAQGDSLKVRAVLRYVEAGTVIADLLREGLLPCDSESKLLDIWPAANGEAPSLYKMLTAKDGKRDVGDAFVRWCVELPGDPQTRLWQDAEVHRSWTRFLETRERSKSLCMVTGIEVNSAISHPKRLRHGADGAKLISSNDGSGFTFRGRFEKPEQAYSLGSITTQKAHNALRWLIFRQGYKQGDQAIVAWAVAGQTLPPIIAGTNDLVDQDEPEPYAGDGGQAFVRRLNMRIAGYAANLTDRDDIVVMALDSATPGRMAITYYRELNGSEYLARIRDWHECTAWPQNMGKERRFTGAPAPRDIAEAAYGRRADEKLRKFTVERLLPCILDGRPIPRDLVRACVQRAMNPAGQEHWEWERTLGIACALVRGSRKKEKYSMALEETRNTRDYLFGRLLAVAEKIESYALYQQGERRETAAERLMQRFSNHPASTWLTIEISLRPYMARLQRNRGGVLHVWRTLLDEISAKFTGEDFTRPGRLDAEFLLGYHCQRAALLVHNANSDEALSDSTPSTPGDSK
jgi:CRISPR-associated protein Csd1